MKFNEEEQMIKCGFCKFAAPFKDVPAEFIIDGQSVCENHVDSTGESFGRALVRVQQGEN
jgi:hypothetical protein